MIIRAPRPALAASDFRVQHATMTRSCASPWCRRTRGPIRGASRGTSRRWPSASSPTATTCACSRPSTRRPLRERCCTAAPGRSRVEAPDYLVSLGRTVRLQGQRRGLEPLDHALRRRDRAAGAAHRRLRRRPRPRAGRAGVAAGCATDWTPAAAGRHVPHLQREPLLERDRQPARARAACSTACTCGSPSPRRRPGPAGASSAATTG